MTSPVAVIDQYTVNENQDFAQNAVVAPNGLVTGGLLGNDLDPDNAAAPSAGLTVIEVRDSSGTTTEIVGPFTDVKLPSGAVFSVTPNGQFTYKPGQAFQSLGRGEEKLDILQYRIEDANNEESSFAEVRFTVEGRNDSPVVKADVAAIDEDATATLNILANDSDVDTTDKFEVKDFQLVSYTVNGNTVFQSAAPTNILTNGFDQTGNQIFGGTPDYTISIDEKTGEVIFEAGDDLKDSLDEGDVGEITFRYNTQDDSGAGNDTSAFTTVKITITDDSPVVVANFPGLVALLLDLQRSLLTREITRSLATASLKAKTMTQVLAERYSATLMAPLTLTMPLKARMATTTSMLACRVMMQSKLAKATISSVFVPVRLMRVLMMTSFIAAQKAASST